MLRNRVRRWITRRGGVVVALTALWVAYMCGAGWFTFAAVRRPLADRQADLHVYLGAIHAVAHGAPLYSYVAENGDPFTYPPFALLVLWPFATLSEATLRVLWTLSTCAGVVVIAFVAVRGRWNSWHVRTMLIAAAGLVLLVSAPLQSNIRFGQVSLFVILLTFADASGVTPRWSRGVLIGVAAAIKLTPLLFVVHLLVTSQRRAAVRAGGVFMACGLLAAVVIPGDSVTFWSGAIFTTSRIGDLAAGGNQSINGMLLRIPLAPGNREVAWLLLACVAASAALYRARALSLSGRKVEAAVTIGCGTLAVSPVSWTHHQVWTLLAGFALLARGTVIHRLAAVAVVIIMLVPIPALPIGAPAAVAEFASANARGLAAFAICCLGLVTAWRATRSHTLVLAGRITLRPRAYAAAGSGGILIAATFIAINLIHVRFLTNSDLTASVWRNILGTTGTGTGLQTAWPPTTFEPLNYSGGGDGTAIEAAGSVGPSVTRLVVSVTPQGPMYDVPLTAGPLPGTRVFAVAISDGSAADLLAYDAHGHVISCCTGKLQP